MTTLAALPLEERVVLSGISWATYERLVNESMGNRRLRFTYDQGELEIMSPSRKHERIKELIARLVIQFTLEHRIPVSAAGSTTLKDQLLEKGLEPDTCFYITNESHVRQRDDLDLTRDPPPDLAIEVDFSASSLDRMAIYEALRVLEVWRCEYDFVTVYRLEANGTYKTSPNSVELAGLPMAIVNDFLARRNETDETSWLSEFRDWVQSLRT